MTEDALPYGVTSPAGADPRRHLAALCTIIETAPDPEGTWRGHVPMSWYSRVCNDKPRAQLAGDKVTRADIIRSVRASDGGDIEALCATIFAWGGMRRDHGKMLFCEARRKEWLPAARQVLMEPMTRAECFDYFRQLRSANVMKGAGPAYFTKLIFFLMHKRDDAMPVGYIMDQWTSRSINLLTGDPRHVLLQGNTVVTDQNDMQHYQRFCRAIEALTVAINARTGKNLAPDEVERQLMSHGGRKQQKGAWRQYLLDNDPPK